MVGSSPIKTAVSEIGAIRVALTDGIVISTE